MQSINNKNKNIVVALLIEANEADVTLIQEIFNETKSNIRLQWVRNGKQALALLRNSPPFTWVHPPDFILLGMNVPNKTGEKTLAEIKSDPMLRKIPIVLLAASDTAGDLQNRYSLQTSRHMKNQLARKNIDQLLKRL